MRRDTSGMTRRQFLRGGMAVAGLTLGGGASALEPITIENQKKIRIGVVGGNFGCSFQWHEHPSCIVEAVSDLRPERRQRLKNVYKCGKSYESLEKLILDRKIDAVAVFTGAPDHVRHCIAAMNEGKHVICAVPAAMALEEAEELLDTVKRTGLTYMMAETSYYRQAAISARKWYQEGRFGEIISSEAEYHHPGAEKLSFDADGKITWRHGLPPMLYPTHCTALITGITGERLVEVTCVGWGDGEPEVTRNLYNNNPFWNANAFFKTNSGRPFRVSRSRKLAVRGTERAQWIGSKMSFYMDHPNGLGPIIIRAGEQMEKDDAGFERKLAQFEKYEQPLYWKTDMLPEPLRHDSGHGGSHTFLTHEFIDALVNERPPTVNIYEALAYTVPGIVAHQSALQGGKQFNIPQFDPRPSIA